MLFEQNKLKVMTESIEYENQNAYQNDLVWNKWIDWDSYYSDVSSYPQTL